MLPTLLLSLTGCAIVDAVNDLRDKIGEFTSPVVVQGIVLHLEPPDDALLAAAVADAAITPGLTATVFVADARTAEELDQAVSGAAVRLQGVAAAEGDPGIFSVWPDDGLTYRAGAEWVLKVETDAGAEGTLKVTLPQPVPVEVPEEHEAGTPMRIDLAGLGYDSALAYVFDTDGGITWTNQPTNALEVFDLTQSSADVKALEIPGSAFPDESIYAVAVAGMRHSTSEQVDGVNTFLSNLMAGQMDLYPVFTSPGLTVVGQLLDVAEPLDDRLSVALDRAGITIGTTATTFVADALADAPTLEEAALPGGQVTVQGNRAVEAVDEGDGYYTVLPEDGLVWSPGATWSVEVAHGVLDGALVVTLPEAPEVSLPATHPMNTELVLDLTGMPFDSAVVLVVDAEGTVVFSDEPQTIDALAERVANPAPLGPVTIPAEVFAGPSLYGVGVAGFVHGPPDGFEGVNPELSALLAGRLAVSGLVVTPL
ncbi:MAG: hypothetical protein ACI8PZ_005502 [Myxococcota bacterium]|jgi:hypothetical protein